MALNPEDLDFISNFNTLWAVFLGAILATLGGFVRYPGGVDSRTQAVGNATQRSSSGNC